jgi:cytochrome c-type biogenesis protein CcmH/NrfF
MDDIATKNLQSADLYPFHSPSEQILFNKIIHELRCSVCQGQPLSDSPMALAVNLRQVIYEQVRAGKPEQAILAFVTERYGEDLKLNPSYSIETGILWFSPLIMVLLAVMILYPYFKKSKSGTKQC